MLTLARELTQRGWDLDLLVVNRRDSAYSASTNVRIVDLAAPRIRSALLPLTGYLRKAKPVVMLSAETPVNALAILARAITGFPKRLVVSERNHLSSVARHAQRPADRLRIALVRHMYPRADLVVAVSQSVGTDLIRAGRLPPELVRTIHGMFDIDAIIRESQSAPPEFFSLGGQSPVILSAGRLNPQKDQATLIRAFSMIRSSLPCRLLILGEGAERPRLQQLAQHLGVAQDVFMPGFVANPYACMAASAVFVLSSAWEGLPGVLIEALACGLPVVSTDCPGGSAEILEDGRYGILTPVGDASALAEAVRKTLEKPIPAESLRRRARDFSIEHVLPEITAALHPEAPMLPSLP
jgi:glycosyltransferase involved in cell wall biosynthesis